MKPTPIIQLTNVSKNYSLHSHKPTLMDNFNYFKNKSSTFTALNDINLRINQGDQVGIIGPNGSGKTTLLRIIAGITQPSTGTIFVNGKIVSLIELTAGFQPDLTGISNIYLNGLLLGMSKQTILQQLAHIIQFADIGNYINQPIYMYSSGMALRLGFSIAIHSKPDILILDENIAAGDAEFKQKIQEKLDNLAKHRVTLILVSHQFDLVKRFCHTFYTLDHGHLEPITLNQLNHIEKIYQK